MRRAIIPTLVLAAAFGLTGCHVAKPAVQSFGNVSVQLPESPNAVAERLHADASSGGYDVWMDGPHTIRVNFGTQRMRIPVPTEYGLWGTAVVFRDTKVNSSAVYRVSAAPGGSTVTLYNNPTYWHPDIQVWLPGPYDVSPGAEMLERLTP